MFKRRRMHIKSEEELWDVDRFRTEHECKEHWRLRRMFLLKHRDNFEEGRLVCLAQVFINMEILGCRYPEETMKLVSSLSEGIIESFREKRQRKLKRTFVQASDAAQSKAQGRKRQPEGQDLSSGVGRVRKNKKSKPINCERTRNDPLDDNQGPSIADNEASSSELLAHTKSSSSANVRGNSKPMAPAPPRIECTVDEKRTSSDAAKSNPFGQLILVEDIKYKHCRDSAILMRSFHLSGFRDTYKNAIKTTILPDGNSFCELVMNGEVLFTSEGTTQSSGREAVAAIALDAMREHCYTIKIRESYVSQSTVAKSFGGKGIKKGGAPLTNDNLGNKLLRKMGWSGGGLGKDQQGIKAPICAVQHVNRAGLGLTHLNFHQSKHNLRMVIERFLGNDSAYDLAFSSDFTKDERKAIRLLARRFNLLAKCQGKGRKQHMVVSKKDLPQDILQRLIASGGSTEKYNLIKPRCML